MDYLSLALTELGNISERRLMRLTDEASNKETLPAFLVQHGGLNSGFMLTQYTAASLASENKVLAHPASADTIPSSANVEDHVSMGANAARHALEILENVRFVLAIELMTAAQAIDLREDGPARLGRGTAAAHEVIRRTVSFLEHDRETTPAIEALVELIRSGTLIEAASAAAGVALSPHSRLSPS